MSQTHPAKLNRVLEIANDHARGNRKVLVWTNFLGNVAELEKLLVHHRTGATPVDNASEQTDRVRELRRFHDDPECGALIATPRTLGEGVSLHRTCQSQVHLDRSFNAGLYLQALDPTNRVGMPPGMQATALALIANGTIDERVQQVLIDKIAAMQQILADPSLRPLALPEDGHAQPEDEAEKSEDRDVLGEVR